VFFLSFSNQAIGSPILEKRDLMLVAKDPESDDCVELGVCEVEPAGIKPDLEVLEDILDDSRQLNLAFRSLFERALESSAKVIRVEAEQVFVYDVGFLFVSNNESHCFLKMFAVDNVSENNTDKTAVRKSYREGHLLGVETAPEAGLTALCC
jgi:hypothetical protein